MAEARLRSSDPSCRLTSADARLMTPSACTISIGIRSVPMRKLWSDRSVCAPQSRSAGISRGPKASLSVRVPADLPRALAMWSIRDHQNHPSRRDTKPTAPETKMLIASQKRAGLLFAKAIKSYHFSAATAGRFFRLFALGDRSRRTCWFFFFRLTRTDWYGWTCRRPLFFAVRDGRLLHIRRRRAFVSLRDFFELQTKLNGRVEKPVD